MLSLENLLANVRTYLPDTELSRIRKAYAYAMRKHVNQKRKSGEPYVVHPIGVAVLLTQLKMDVPSIAAGLLHDCVEDTDSTTEDVRIIFGPEVAFLVDGMTKLSHLPYRNRQEKQAENFRKMLLAMARDIRVVIIKLADRLDNMRTLGAMKPSAQDRIARETLDIHAPIANRLGIQWIKTEMEDLAFKHLNPTAFSNLAKEIEKAEKPRKKFITEVQAVLQKEMELANIPAEIQGRQKNLYGIFQKMQATSKRLDQVYDVVAFRIITDDLGHCYEALGRVHAMFTPVPGRFKDYVALPKQNGYQSLHTSVVWTQGKSASQLEIQIRTQEMHRVAENGIAAHWVYKEGQPLSPKDERQYSWLRQLMEVQREVSDPNEFIESVKIDLFEDEVFVFTPQGEVKALPKGATPVDFAFGVHSEVGNQCSGAKVNGVMVPLKYRLNSGDTVEIITSVHQHPNKDWLKFVVTGRARAKINHYVRATERQRARALARDLLERRLRKFKYSLPKLKKAGELDKAAKAFKLSSEDELLYQIGMGRISLEQVLLELVPEDKRIQPHNKDKTAKGGILERLTRPSNKMKVQGVDNVMIRLAGCCNPVPGDRVVGFITRGRGVTVHVATCKRVLDADPERRIDVDWDDRSKTLYTVGLKVFTDNKPGLLAEMSKCFSSNGLNITEATCRSQDPERATNTFKFEVANADQIRKVIKHIQKIAGVYSVQRIQNG